MAYINDGRPIYITYARNGNNPGWEHIADIKDKIATQFRQNNIDVYDDDGDLKTGDSITEFETEIGDSEFTILIFSDKYFRSPHCMYEFVQVLDAYNKGNKRKLVCIKSGDCNLKDNRYLDDLKKYWVEYGGERYKDELAGMALTPIQKEAKNNRYYVDYLKELYPFFSKCKYENAETLDIDALINDFKALFEAEYYLCLDNQKKGPYDLRTLKRKFKALPKTTLVWKKGMSDWAQADTIPELKSLFPVEPPPIPKFASSAKVIESVENHIITPDLHSAVDLGLSVLWADRNIGADNPWDYGGYFAWGETKPKPQFAWDNYKYANGNYDKLTKYCNKKEYGNNGFTDRNQILLPEDDAATANWHGEWRMPTIEEFEELRTNCKWDWTKNYNGKKGYIVSGNGNQIFLPAAGWRSDTLDGSGSYGVFWSSSLGLDYPTNARDLGFLSGDVGTGNYYRCDGLSVRAVRRKY